MMTRVAILTLAIATTTGAAWAQDGFAPRARLDVTRCEPGGCERISSYVFPQAERHSVNSVRLSAPTAGAMALRFQQSLGPSRLYLDTADELR